MPISSWLRLTSAAPCRRASPCDRRDGAGGTHNSGGIGTASICPGTHARCAGVVQLEAAGDPESGGILTPTRARRAPPVDFSQ